MSSRTLFRDHQKLSASPHGLAFFIIIQDFTRFFSLRLQNDEFNSVIPSFNSVIPSNARTTQKASVAKKS